MTTSTSSTGTPTPGALSFTLDGLTYALDRAPRKNGRRSVVTVRRGDSTPITDRVDLYAFRSRRAFAQLVADLMGMESGTVLGHLAVVLEECERAAGRDERPSAPVLTPARERAARKLLDARDALDRAGAALDALGYVGEETPKRLAYLVATSRLLAKPLSAILFAASGTGKSELLDKLSMLMPPESVEFLSRLTPASLYYLGPDALRHKLVVVDEQAGAAEADYAIRTLQTKGLLRLAVTVKGKTEPLTVNGPIALLSGTTRTDLNPENLSRCLELALDDSADQTRRVQEAQRRAWAGERAAPLDVQQWQDAQRLLEPLDVVIPFAPQLAFPSRTTKDRRDHAKLLTLVAAHALLAQRRRDRDRDGRLIATAEDYTVVHALLARSVEASVEGLSLRAAALYRALAPANGAGVTRREAAAQLGWSYMTALRALDELLVNELAQPVEERTTPKRYVVIDGGLLGVGAATLTPPSALNGRGRSRSRI